MMAINRDRDTSPPAGTSGAVYGKWPGDAHARPHTPSYFTKNPYTLPDSSLTYIRLPTTNGYSQCTFPIPTCPTNL